MDGNDFEGLMTADEVADYLSLAKGTVYNKANRGEMPSLKVGRALRFRRSAIDAWVENQNPASAKGAA